MIKITTQTKNFDFTGESYRELEDAISDVRGWINDNVSAENVIAINLMSDEAGYSFVVWYRKRQIMV